MCAQQADPTTVDDASKSLPIEWQECGPGVFANSLVISHDDESYFLTFYQVAPPQLLGTEAERKAQLEKLSAVRALPVARVVVSNAHFEQMAKLIRNHGSSATERGT